MDNIVIILSVIQNIRFFIFIWIISVVSKIVVNINAFMIE